MYSSVGCIIRLAGRSLVPRRKHRKRSKKDEIEILAGRLFKYGPLEGSRKDLVCYLPRAKGEE